MKSKKNATLESLESRQLLSAYFVDAQAPDGGNGSAGSPWNSIAQVNLAPPFVAGDSIAFEGGDTFTGSLVFDNNDVGSALAPITVTSYGNGRATINAGTGNGLLVRNTGGFNVTNLNFVGTGQAANSSTGIWFDNTQGGTSKFEHVFIDSVDVRGFGKYGINVGGSGTSGKAGFGLPDANPANRISGVRITNADVHDNILGGIHTGGVFSASSSAYANQNVYVGYSRVWNNTGYANSQNHSGDGIEISDARNVVLERNVAHDNGAKNTHVGGPVGIWVWDVDNAVIQYNESYRNQTNSTADGGGFDLDGGVTNSVVQYNYSHDNAGAGYGIYQFSGARAFHDNVIRYNISQNDGRKNSYAAIDFWNGNGGNGISNIEVYNNTVYVSPSNSGTPEAIRFQSGTTNVHVRNNIFQTAGGLQVIDVQAKHTGLLFQGNSYSTNGTLKLKWFAKVYNDLASLRKGAGAEMVGSVAVGSQLSPNLPKPGQAGTIVNIDAMGDELATFYRPTASLSTGGNTAGSNGGALNLWIQFGQNPGQRDFYGNALPSGSDATFRYTVGAWQA